MNVWLVRLVRGPVQGLLVASRFCGGRGGGPYPGSKTKQSFTLQLGRRCTHRVDSWAFAAVLTTVLGTVACSPEPPGPGSLSPSPRPSP